MTDRPDRRRRDASYTSNENHLKRHWLSIALISYFISYKKENTFNIQPSNLRNIKKEAI